MNLALNDDALSQYMAYGMGMPIFLLCPHIDLFAKYFMFATVLPNIAKHRRFLKQDFIKVLIYTHG